MASADSKKRLARNRLLGNSLRRLYDGVANEEVPDDFLKLLDDADRKSVSKASDDDDG